MKSYHEFSIWILYEAMIAAAHENIPHQQAKHPGSGLDMLPSTVAMCTQRSTRRFE